MLDVLWLIPAFPLAGFLIILLLGRRLGEPLAGWLATVMVAASFVVSVGVYIDMLGMSAEERSHVEVIFSWIPVGALQVDSRCWPTRCRSSCACSSPGSAR